MSTEFRKVKVGEDIRSGTIVSSDGKQYQYFPSTFGEIHVCRRGRRWMKFRYPKPVGVTVCDIAKDGYGWIQTSGLCDVPVAR